MKKWILSVLLLSVVSGFTAGAVAKQTSISLSPFSNLKVAGTFSVSLVRGADYRALVTVEESYMDYIICQVTDGVLKIDIDERRVPAEIKRQFRAKGTSDPAFSAIIYVPELIRSVELDGKAVLCDSEDVFDKGRVAFDLDDNSNMKNVEISSQEVELSLQNKSTADVKVSCKKLAVDTSNTSSLTIEEESEDSSYSLQGSSKIVAKSHAVHMEIKTKANSSMKLFGSGDSISYNLSGTSEVNALSFEVPDAKITMTSVCALYQAAYRSLTLNLNGGSALYFTNEPQVSIENIKSSTVSRVSNGAAARKS